MDRMTTLGLNERLERVLTYSLFWFSGLLFFIFEKNRSVRWHAVQSMLVFGTLSFLMFAVSLLQGFLGGIPLLGWLVAAGLGLLFNVLWWVMIGLWLWLMVMAWIRPDYRLPIVGNWASNWV